MIDSVTPGYDMTGITYEINTDTGMVEYTSSENRGEDSVNSVNMSINFSVRLVDYDRTLSSMTSEITFGSCDNPELKWNGDEEGIYTWNSTVRFYKESQISI